MSHFVIKNSYITMTFLLRKSIEVSERGKNNDEGSNLYQVYLF